MHKKILVGLDGSEGSFKALTAAIDLARLSSAEIHSLSVEELPGYAGTVSELVEEKASANGIYTKSG